MRATIYFDGGGENPGIMKIGYVIFIEDGRVIYEEMDTGSHGTNNIAEFMALIMSINKASEHGVTHAKIYGDSQLICNAVNGKMTMRKPHLKEILDLFYSELRRLPFKDMEVEWKPREKNIAGWLIDNDPYYKKKFFNLIKTHRKNNCFEPF